MNKFFRLVSMFAIAGVTFAYTSCTDYSEDIDKANTRIDEVGGAVGKLDGRLSTVEGQVKNLETTVSSLQAAQTKADAAITDLQTALGKLQEKHAADIAKLEKDYAAADAALKSEIEGKISTLNTQFTEKVTALTTQIGVLQTKVDGIDETVASIQETIKTLATKKDVDAVVATLATKDALAEANKAIAALNTALETVQSKVATLDEDLKTVKVDIAGIKTKLGEAQTAIVKAQEDATKALGEIAKIKEALKSYALKAEVEAKIEQLVAADLAATDRMNGIDEKIAGIGIQIAGLIEKDTELGEKIAQLFEEKFNKADFADAFKTAYEARFSTDFAEKFAEAWAEYFQPAFDTAFETAWNAKFQGEFDSALEKVLGIYAEKDVLKNKLEALDGKDAELQDKITKLDEKLDQAVEDLNDKITELNEKVEQYNTALNARIDAVLGIIAGRLTSIVFVPEYYYDGVPAILFETIAYDPLNDAQENVAATTFVDGKQNSISANKFKRYTTALTKVQYRLNPRTVGVDCADFSFVGDKADYVVTRATAPAAPVSIEGVTEYDPATGYVTFTVKKNEKLNVTDNTNKNLDIVALKAVLKKGLTDAEAKAEEKPEVYSEYAHVNEIAYSAANLAISDKDALAQYAKDKKTAHEYAKTFDAAAAQAPVYQMPYNSDPFDLKALVATCINTNITTPGLEAAQNHAELNLNNYELDYKFSVAKTPYEVTSGVTKTDQQTVIECVDAEKGLYKVKSAAGIEFNKESIGRTPIVRVDLVHNGEIVTRAFIKLVISVEKTKPQVDLGNAEKSVVLSCPDTEVNMIYNVDSLRKNIYQPLDIDHVNFWKIYDVAEAYVTKNDEAGHANITVPELKDGIASDGRATKEVVWNFTHGEVGKIGSKTVVTGYLKLRNNADAYNEYPSEITFKFVVNFSLPEPVVVAKEKEIFWKNGVLQANVNRPASKTDDSKNCWFNTPIEEQPWYELSVKGLPCNETPAFRIKSIVVNGGKPIDYDEATQGVKLDELNGEVSISLDRSSEFVKAALNSEKGLQANVEWYAVGKSGDEYVLWPFTVNFITPVKLILPETLYVRDAVDDGDEINLGIQGLLKDWRDSVIVAPLGMIEKTAEDFYWKKTCSGHSPVVIPGYTRVVEDAWYEVIYDDVTINIPTGERYFKAFIQLYEDPAIISWFKDAHRRSINYSYYYENYYYEVKKQKVWMPKPNYQKADVVFGVGRTEAEAVEAAYAEVKKLDANYIDPKPYYGKASELSDVVDGFVTEPVTIKTIKEIKYHPAKTEEVKPEIITVDCNPKPGPSDDVLTEGYTVGCWTWTKFTYPYYDYDLGQYWQFYGPFSDIVFDLGENYMNVTTDLDDTKLPSGASLTPDGYKLKYENVLSPVLKEYHISVPVYIQYGWGVLRDTLTITVNPVNSVK